MLRAASEYVLNLLCLLLPGFLPTTFIITEFDTELQLSNLPNFTLTASCILVLNICPGSHQQEVRPDVLLLGELERAEEAFPHSCHWGIT